MKDFTEILNRMDFERIDEGLRAAWKALVDMDEPNAQALASRDYRAVMALMEALCCRPYHTSREKLLDPFQDPFRDVQTKRVLKLADVVPAMTSFLFDSEPSRRRFATENWKKLLHPIDRDAFDWAIQDPLMDEMRSVSTQEAPTSEVRRFWEGLFLIVNKLDQPLITHQLRGMEITPDIYALALYHLNWFDSKEILEAILKVMHSLLRKSPTDFWAAYAAISATTIAEQIFTSKSFERLIADPISYEDVDGVQIPGALSWIPLFLTSLPSAQQYDACRTILNHLLVSLQHPTAPRHSKQACFRAALNAMLTVLRTFVDCQYEILNATSFIVVHNVLSLVGDHIRTFVACASMHNGNKEEKELAKLGVEVVKLALDLCGKSTLSEFVALLDHRRDINHDLPSVLPTIWDATLGGFRPGNHETARSVLLGLRPLVALDQLGEKQVKDEKGKLRDDPLKSSKLRFNNEIVRVNDIMYHVYERLSDFTPGQLRELVYDDDVAESMYAGLTPPTQSIYEAAVQVIKTLTGESGRREAFVGLFDRFFTTTLLALAWATRRITVRSVFAPIPYLIKTSRDVLDSLCDVQGGLLRVRPPATNEEKRAIIRWWTDQWNALSTIFRTFEYWSSGRPNKAMEDHARDIMEYAEHLFDQYSVFATTVDDGGLPAKVKASSTTANKSLGEDLMKHPCNTMEYMAKWLRLRDAYLLDTIVNLLCKVMRRLAQFNMEIEPRTLKDIENIGKGENRRLMLTQQQRAELWRAYEDHQGLWHDAEPTKKSVVKQETLSFPVMDSTKKTSSALSSRSATPPSLSEDVRSLSKTVDANKSVLDLMRSRHETKKLPVVPKKSAPGETAQSIKESREKAKQEKQKRDAEYLAKVHSLRAPRAIVQGEGSGLKGVGVIGKDHGPQQTGIEIMVSSDESSDDDGGAEVRALITKKSDKSKKLSELEKNQRRALLQQPTGPVKKTKIVRSAKDMRARLIPNMDNLHLTILKWDIFHQGDQPPGDVQLQEVSNTFRSPNDYYATFYPLLISEAWRALRTAYEENQQQNSYRPFELNVVNRLSVDSFFEIGTTMQPAENKDNNISEGDIVLLSRGTDSKIAPADALCLSRAFRVTRKRDAIEVAYRIAGHAAHNQEVLSAFNPNSKIQIRGVKITSMTTIEREYAALKSLQYYDLCDEILSAKPSPILSYYSDTKFKQIQENYKLNLGQAKAIWAAHENDGFTLVQGPPGTGKTKTIVAMVGALLSNKLVTTGTTISQPRNSDSKTANAAPIQKKLLICAPSNAAVDELVTRLKEGVKTLTGQSHKINVIRLGRSDAIDANVKDVTLDELVRTKMEGETKNGLNQPSEREKLHLEAGRLKTALETIRTKLATITDEKSPEYATLKRELDVKKRAQMNISTKIDENKASGNTAARENEINRRRLQQEIIDSAHVLCATLSGSGHEMFKNLSVEFETVIIDEAAQCIELSALIPLKYGCSKCILVGDPRQLPPTVLSRSAADYGYDQSLFVRMQQNHPKDVHLLDTQYRMHPAISKFPSEEFYEGKLIDGAGMAELRTRPWHNDILLGPYRFFDVKGIQSTGAGGRSFINTEEIKVAMLLYNRLKKICKTAENLPKMAIITPYKAQLKELRYQFERKYTEQIFDMIEFNTTDAFQGRESDIIIFSCVRARSDKIGFLNDIRRMNVGLTRAKSSLWVLGDSPSLMAGKFWAKFVQDAKERQVYTEGDVSQAIMAPITRVDQHMSGTSTPNSRAGSRAASADVEMTDAPAIPKGPASMNAGRGQPRKGPVDIGTNAVHSVKPTTLPRRESLPKATVSTTMPAAKDPHKRPREPSSPASEAVQPSKKVSK